MPRIIREADLPVDVQQRRAKERAKLVERAKDPQKLTDKERLTRLELLLGVD